MDSEKLESDKIPAAIPVALFSEFPIVLFEDAITPTNRGCGLRVK